MKAQVLHSYDPALTAPQWVRGEDVADPQIVKSSDVIICFGDAGVCRTDLHIISGIWHPHTDPSGTALLPLIMGHENAGWIEEIGPAVEGFRNGDPVIVHPKVTRGSCIACRRGHNMHGEGKFPGLDSKGGYAKLLHTSARNLIALPKTLAPKDVAPYAYAGLTAFRAARKRRSSFCPTRRRW